MLELSVLLHVFVVALADAVEADGHPAQAGGEELVDAPAHQRPVRRHVGIEAQPGGVLDHGRQVAVQQRFAAVEACRGDAGRRGVVEAVAHRLQVEVLADHEVAAVAAALAAEIAGRGHGEGDLARAGADQRRHPLRDVVP